MLLQIRLKELLSYNKTTGIFRWRQRRGGTAHKGTVAGRINTQGYVGISVDGVRYQAHQLAILYVEGWLPEEVDHRNLKKSDNRYKNLRVATRSQNMMNKAIRSDNKTGITGVTLIRRSGGLKYLVQVQALKVRRRGVFNTLATAEKFKILWKAELHGEFSR